MGTVYALLGGGLGTLIAGLVAYYWHWKYQDASKERDAAREVSLHQAIVIESQRKLIAARLRAQVDAASSSQLDDLLDGVLSGSESLPATPPPNSLPNQEHKG